MAIFSPTVLGASLHGTSNQKARPGSATPAKLRADDLSTAPAAAKRGRSGAQGGGASPPSSNCGGKLFLPGSP